MATPAATARAVVQAARKWAKLQTKLGRLADSKRARKVDVEKAKKDLLEASKALYETVMALEELLHSAKTLAKAGVRAKRGSGPKIPWKSVFEGVEVLAGAAARAARGDRAEHVQVIDVTPGKSS